LTAAAAVGGGDVVAFTAKVAKLLLRVIPESPEFRRLVAHEVQAAQAASANPGGATNEAIEAIEIQRKAVSVLAMRMDNAVKQCAAKAELAKVEQAMVALGQRLDHVTGKPAAGGSASISRPTKPLAEELELCQQGLADLATRLDDIESHIATMTPMPGKPASVDIDALRDQVIESIRPLLPKSENIAEFVQATVQTAVDASVRPTVDAMVQAAVDAAVPSAVEQAMAAGGGGGGGGGLDVDTLRKMLPELLTSPEVRSTIITTVVIEALQDRSTLGAMTGIRAMLKEEVKKIATESVAHAALAAPGHLSSSASGKRLVVQPPVEPFSA
jgi:hypothetical protein